MHNDGLQRPTFPMVIIHEAGVKTDLGNTCQNVISSPAAHRGLGFYKLCSSST